MEPKNVLIVVPCFNEADRLDVRRFLDFAKASPKVGFVLVNDGSTDATLDVLYEVASLGDGSFEVLDNGHNLGKAESVRRGVIFARGLDAEFIGYWDADLATPLEEIPRFQGILSGNAQLQLVTGARVKMLGWPIDRNELRHYLGRVFATLVSIMLGLDVYDTQCGAKLFRASSLLDELFGQEFISRWVFDVEILAQLVVKCSQGSLPELSKLVREIPVREWKDVPGSKINLTVAPRVFLDLVYIHGKYRSRKNKIGR